VKRGNVGSEQLAIGRKSHRTHRESPSRLTSKTIGPQKAQKHKEGATNAAMRFALCAEPVPLTLEIMQHRKTPKPLKAF